MTKAPLNPRTNRERRPRSYWRPSTPQPRICGHPVYAVPVRVWLYHGILTDSSDWVPLHPCCAHLQGVCPPLHHPVTGPGWPGPDRLLRKDPHRAWLQLHHHCQAGKRARHQGETVVLTLDSEQESYGEELCRSCQT